MKEYNKNKILYLLAVIALLILPYSNTYAQTPGGIVLDVELWLSADKVNGAGGMLPANEESIETWSSVLPGGRSYVKNDHTTASNNEVPTFIATGSSLMNFQPHLNFGTSTAKLINKDNLFDLTKAYYVFHVSRTTSGTNRVLFAFSASNGTGRNNNVGWYSGAPYFELGGSNRVHQGNNKLYGVCASIIPNNTSTASSSYMNGIVNSFNGREFDAGTYNMSVIGNSSSDIDYFFIGDLQELIILSADNGSTLSEDDLDLAQINTYLAIKYGITLEYGNYVNSSGNIVWNRSVNTSYNNNIFGLARDNASGLHQKQAKSTDGKELTIYVGDELSDLNANNTSDALNDGDYLLLGSNASKKLVVYNYSQGTAFLEEGSFDRDIDVRNELTFRAQATRTFSDVKIVSEADYILISNTDDTFAPNNTRIYKVNDQGYASVRIDDGDYISFAFYRGAPGGVGANLELWLSADRLSGGSPLSNGDNVSSWDDISGNGRYFKQNGTDLVPKFSESGLNYHPAVNFSDDRNEGTATENNARKLVSAEVFPFSTSNSYYAFYVSRLDSLSGYSTVFDWNENKDNNFGWNDDGNLWLETATTNYANTAVDKNYGIGTAIIPNTTGTGQMLYHDGVGASLAGRVMDITPAGITQAVIGNSSLGATESFYGDIQEIIIYSGTSNQVMDSTNMKKVHSYLAIKYGIDLQTNYISSTNAVVWDRTTNTGYTNYVFGLANDPSSGLHIKQSTSTEAGDIIAFVGDELADLNANNTGSVPADQFMMLGSNGGGELLDYQQDPDNNPPTYMAGTLDEKVNFLSGTILKAQLTGTSSFTFKLIGPGKYIVVSQTPTFDPANTRLYKKDENNEGTEITVNNGDYIGFALYATGPGGIVRGLRMWLDADNKNMLTLNDQKQVMAWKDKSTISNTIYTYDAVKGSYSYTNPPTYKESTIHTNFHPAVNFYSNSQSTTVGSHIEYLGTHRGPSSVDNPDAYTFINVVYTGDAINQRSYFVSFGGFGWDAASRHPVFGMIGGRSEGIVGRYYEVGGPDLYGNVNLFNIGTTSLNYVTVKKRTSVTFESNGIKNVLSRTSVGRGGATKLNGRGMLGAGSLRYASLKGVLGQSIFYEKELTDNEKHKINSYLGLKYASTIRPDGNGTFNYIFSDKENTSVWNGSEVPYSNYYNNIAALIRDDESELRNNVARSTDAGAIITMMLRGHAEGTSGQGESSLLPINHSALIWGNNGVMTQTEFSSEQIKNLCGAIKIKKDKIWMVKKTENLGKVDVSIRIRQGDFEGYVSPGYQIVLLVADNPIKLQNNEWDLAVPSSYLKDVDQQSIDFTFASDFTYFSLGIKPLPGACEACDFEGIKKIEFNRQSWTPNGLKEKLFNLGDDGSGNGTDFTVNMKTDVNPITWASRYPRYSSQNSLRLNRRGNSEQITEITTSVAAASKFQIFDLDRQGSRYKEVEIYGLCEEGIVVPTLSEASNRSSYDILGNVARAKRAPTSSYTNARGKLNVSFEYPVEKIYIKERGIRGSTNGLQTFGISPLEFSCPAPLPPYSEAGLAFSKQAPDTLVYCGLTTLVDYTFRIYNASCERKGVSVCDTLPENLCWDPELVFIPETAKTDQSFNVSILDVDIEGNNRVLKIENLTVPGSAEPFVFTAQAKFINNESIVNKDYENQAWLQASRIVEDVPEEIDPQPSADFYRGDGFKSKTHLRNGGARLQPVTVSVVESRVCYGISEDLTIILKVNNPNSFAVTDMLLDVAFNEEFEYVNNSLNSSISGLSANPTFELDGSTPIPGFFYLEGFTLAGNTESTISFKVKTPAKSGLVGVLDEDGAPIDEEGNKIIGTFDPVEHLVTDLVIEYAFDTEMNDPCIISSLNDANGEIVMPFCRSKECIITNQMLQPKIKMSKASF